MAKSALQGWGLQTPLLWGAALPALPCREKCRRDKVQERAGRRGPVMSLPSFVLLPAAEGPSPGVEPSSELAVSPEPEVPAAFPSPGAIRHCWNVSGMLRAPGMGWDGMSWIGDGSALNVPWNVARGVCSCRGTAALWAWALADGAARIPGAEAL